MYVVLVSDELVPARSYRALRHEPTADWPDIANTCKQLRKGVLPVFLGNNTFSVRLIRRPSSLRHRQDTRESFDSREFRAFGPWLNKFKGLGIDLKRLVSSMPVDLTIFAIGSQATTKSQAGTGRVSTRMTVCYS